MSRDAGRHPTPDAASTSGTDVGLSREQLLMLAHELRGALTVVAGYADLLRRPLDDDSQRTAIDGIGRAVQRADQLLEDALLGGEEATVRAERLDLATLAERVADEQRAATGREIDVRIDARPGIYGDEGAVSRLLANLIDNAVKYSLSDDPVEVVVASTTDVGTVTVLDRGPGIAEKDRDAVFAPFTRLVGTEGVSGSGVGLAVVHDVAAAHGGSARIEGRDGGGTAITVSLPLG